MKILTHKTPEQIEAISNPVSKFVSKKYAFWHELRNLKKQYPNRNPANYNNSATFYTEKYGIFDNKEDAKQKIAELSAQSPNLKFNILTAGMHFSIIGFHKDITDYKNSKKELKEKYGIKDVE